MTKIKLSIIIVNWNTQALLKQCLESIVSSNQLSVTSNQSTGYQLPSTSYPLEIIVVDNGSTDSSVEMVKSLITDHQSLVTIHLIENKDNVGFAKANNQGLKTAQGDYIMLLNSDTIVMADALNELVLYLEQNPDTAISPQLLLQNAQPQNDYFMKFPNLWQVILYHNPVIRPLITRTKVFRGLLFNPHGGNNIKVDQLPGAALIATKEVWNKVGGLDESYKFFFEDVDWAWRAMEKGIKRVVVSSAGIIHLGGASWKQHINNNKTLVYRQFFSSMLLFCQKNYAPFKYQLIRWAVVMNMLITLKFVLAWYFIKTPTKQTNLW